MDATRTVEPDPGATRLPRLTADRRRRLTHRALPLVLMALAAFIAGSVVGALHVAPERQLAKRFVEAWQRHDYAGMHRLLSQRAQRKTSLSSFADAYREAAATATATSMRAGSPRDVEDGTVPVPVRVRTRLFGTIRGTVRIAFEGSGDTARIDWSPAATFPGVPAGHTLSRRSELPPRATILARDGQVLAKGSERASDISGVAVQVVGETGPPPPDRRLQMRALGYPDDASVGLSGLERAFDERLAGRPGGTLYAGTQVIARATARPAPPLRTSISPKLEAAAVAALGGRNGAVAVLRPATGEVLALAGAAFSGLSPPGSTFKLVTTTAALEDHKVNLSDTFPVRTAAILEGVSLSNANGESCGGDFREAFAESCNSVFAPLGVKVGPRRLVQVAEHYGFNKPMGIEGAAISTIPPPDQIGDDLAVGSTAIGQGKVQTSALEMTSIAATIGNRGLRARPTLRFGTRPRLERVTSPQVAATLRSLMVGVVRFGTGTAAQIEGLTVAGKTGTAELGGGLGGQNIQGNTDAWFVSFAPARAPRLAVGVVMFRAGAGGAAAAPVAHDVLVSGLKG